MERTGLLYFGQRFPFGPATYAALSGRTTMEKGDERPR